MSLLMYKKAKQAKRRIKSAKKAEAVKVKSTPKPPQNPVRATNVPSEDAEQALFVQWFRRNYPNVRIFAIPNGGLRNIAVAMKLKVTGVVAGVPDLYIPEWNVWIEMKKRRDGVTSKEQKDWIEYLNNIGHAAFVCAGNEAAQNVILNLAQEQEPPFDEEMED